MIKHALIGVGVDFKASKDLDLVRGKVVIE